MGGRNITLADLGPAARRQAEDALVEDALRLAKEKAEPKPKPNRKQKYNAVRTCVDGEWFDSKREAARFEDLKKMERAGEIAELKRHPVFVFEVDGKPLLIKSEGYPNGRKAKFTPDFQYRCLRTDRRIAEDVKGGKATATESYKLRRALFEALFPEFALIEVTK